MRTISSRWLLVWAFSLSIASGVWIYGRSVPWPAWLAALAIVAAIWKWPFALEFPEQRAAVGLRDWALTICIAAPSIVNLAATWNGEFPTSGDQFVHNGYGLEAYAFWWPWAWLAAVASVAIIVIALRRNDRSVLPLVAFAALVVLAMFNVPGRFAVRYPSLLHFVAVPLRALIPIHSPIDIERLVNTAAIPIWLLVLRPRLLGRRVDLFAVVAGVLLFWQRDVVYYATSDYLEPCAIVLMLVAGEHLLRSQRALPWIPLILIGTAALFKDQMIIALPIVAVVFLPLRKPLPHIATAAVAIVPFGLWALRSGSNARRGASISWVPLMEHATQWIARVSMQFGPSLPVVAIAVVALIVLALRNRGALALLLVTIAHIGVFFFAAVQRDWPGYPRTNLVPLACAAVALAFVLEPAGARAWIAAAVVAALNVVPLVPFLRDGFAASDERNFFEHRDAPIYYPIREILERQTLVPPGGTIDVLYNGRRLYSYYFPGLPEDEYPDLASRYRLRMKSFAFMPDRCRCTATEAQLAVFIRFKDLGASRPERPAIENEDALCRSFLQSTCSRRVTITHRGTIVGILGVAH